MKSVGMVNNLNFTDKSSIFKAILKLKLNKNQQLRFIEYIQDLSIIKEMPVEHILSDPGLQVINGQKDGNIPQKARQALAYLKAMRFPRLAEAEKHMQAVIHKLNLPPGSRIRNDPSFENREICLEILFEDGSDLKRKLKSLGDSLELAKK